MAELPHAALPVFVDDAVFGQHYADIRAAFFERYGQRAHNVRQAACLKTARIRLQQTILSRCTLLVRACSSAANFF
jgi:hypothetical protein